MGIERSRAIGLDVETWLTGDLIDVLTIGGGYAPMAMAESVREMVTLCHKYEVPVYPCISASGMRREFGSIEAWRGAAMNALNAGADGVLSFNFFPTKRDERLSQIGETATLAGLDKVYGIDNIVTDTFEGDLRPGLVAPDRLPLPLLLGGTATAKLMVGEDIVANAPEGKAPKVTLRLRVDGAVAGDEIAVILNGRAMTDGRWEKQPANEPADCWHDLPAEPSAVRKGENVVQVKLSSQPAPDRGVVSLGGLALSVRYE